MTGAPTPSASGVNCSSRRCRSGPGIPSSTSAAAPGCALPLLQRKVGPAGTIIGIDESEQMLPSPATAWPNTAGTTSSLIAAPVATAAIDGMADAALFCAVHDIMQSRAALDNIVAHLRPGSPVAATGGKQPALWMWPLRAWVIHLHRPFITDFAGFDRPWRLLAKHCPRPAGARARFHRRVPRRRPHPWRPADEETR